MHSFRFCGSLFYVGFATSLCCSSNIGDTHERNPGSALPSARLGPLSRSTSHKCCVNKSSMQRAPCSSQFQYATVPVLLGGIVAKKGNRGETLPGTDACGNGVSAGGCGGRHRVAGSDLASPVGLDAQYRLQPRQVRDYERTAKIGRILFVPGPFGIFGAVKWAIFPLLNLWKTLGMPPVFRQDLLKWATKSTHRWPVRI